MPVVHAVVVEHQHSVRSAPYVELDAPDAQLVGLEQRRHGVLVRTFGPPVAAVGHHLRPALERKPVLHVAAHPDQTGQTVHHGLVLRILRLVERQHAAVAAIVGDGRRVEHVVLLETVDVGHHAVVRRIGTVGRSLLVELELHGHAVLAGEGAGVVETAVGNRMVEEMVGLLVGDVEAQRLPVLGALRLPVGNPVEELAQRVNILADGDGQLAAVVVRLGHPVEARELQIPVLGRLEPLHQLVDIPLRHGQLVLLLREVHRPAVQLAPVLLVADGLGKSQHDLVLETGFAQLGDLLRDALIERRERLALLEDAVEEPCPLALAGVQLLIADGVVAARTVFEFEEQESVEEPVLRAVGEPVHDIGTELVRRPVQAVRAALIDKRHVLHVVRLLIGLCRGAAADRDAGGQQRGKSESLQGFHL